MRVAESARELSSVHERAGESPRAHELYRSNENEKIRLTLIEMSADSTLRKRMRVCENCRS